MNVTSSQPDHLYILDRMKGSFKDVGEASTMDRVLSHLSAGGMRVALIAPTYGMVIFLLGWGLWSVAKYRLAD